MGSFNAYIDSYPMYVLHQKFENMTSFSAIYRPSHSSKLDVLLITLTAYYLHDRIVERFACDRPLLKYTEKIWK